MALRRQLNVLLPVLVGLAVSVSIPAIAQDADASAAQVSDPERGKNVFQKIGNCVSCHGWAGDGKTGRNPLARAGGADLRASQLDAAGLAEVIKCGIPGTAMPYHDAAAYRDDRCYGLVLADFNPGAAPVRGKTFRERQLADLIAYMQASMIGLGAPTSEECAAFFGASAEKACATMAPD